MPEAQPRPETVLIVDDDVRVVELLQVTLGGRGYNVLGAYDGESALSMVRQQRPDLLVLDVRLPRKSGFEVVDTIRRDASYQHLPIILISANAATETRLQGLKLGADDYLTKPFSPRELIIKIRRILDRAQDRSLLVLKTEVLEDEVRRNRDVLLQMRHELGESLNRMGVMLSQVIELNQYHSIEQLLERFVVTTISNLDFEQVILLSFDATETLHSRVWRGVEDGVAHQLTLPGKGAVANLLQTVGRPMRLEELANYPDAREEVLRLSTAGLALLVPVLANRQLRGILGLGERTAGEPLGRFDYKLLEILGYSIAAALQNAESFEETQRSFLDTTTGLITNIEERYPFVRGHSERVKDISLAIGREVGLNEEELESLRYGALLHDLGQLEQYRELLDDTVTLSPSDRQLHRRRVAEQVVHLLGPGGKGAVGEIVRHHQEYWDGTGLPDGLRELEIPLGARIVALANAWDALLSERPHRAAYGHEEAVEILGARSGRQFDPNLVPVLIRLVGKNLVETAQT